MKTITLLTDFATADGYVGAMKGVIETICPEARVLDLAHDLPAGDVVHGAFALASAVETFPPDTVHVAVVDPGVGSRRRGVLVECATGWFVGPDNGLLTLAARPPRIVRVLDKPQFFRAQVSRTFHGRDVFASVAAHLVSGVEAAALGSRSRELTPLALPVPRRSAGRLEATVLYRDHFGNLVSNLRAEDLPSDPSALKVEIGSATVAGLRASYAEAGEGCLLALIGSHGHLEIAVSGGSAAAQLAIGPGAELRVTWPAQTREGRDFSGTD